MEGTNERKQIMEENNTGKKKRGGKNMSGTRRSNGMGCLVSKGPGKPFLAKWMFQGKLFTRTTGEVSRSKAEKVLERFTRPFREERIEDVLLNMQNLLMKTRNSRIKKSLKISEMFDVWVKECWMNGGESTSGVYRSAMNHMETWMREKLSLEDSSRVDARIAGRYLEELKGDVSAQTWNLRLVLFKRIWKELGVGYDLDADAFERFKKIKIGKKKSGRRVLGLDELKRLLDACGDDGDTRALLVIGMYTGLRLGDAACLKWSGVDFAAGKISVVTMKTGDEVVIPMHADLLRTLEGMKNGESGEYVSERNARFYKSGYIEKVVKDVFARAGLTTSETVGGKRVVRTGFHSLRHTFVSMTVNSGMPAMLVADTVGHADVKMTANYFHKNDEKVKKCIDMLPSITS